MNFFDTNLDMRFDSFWRGWLEKVVFPIAVV
jgi:hypothetical protein